jgi:hypothetical protein
VRVPERCARTLAELVPTPSASTAQAATFSKFGGSSWQIWVTVAPVTPVMTTRRQP